MRVLIEDGFAIEHGGGIGRYTENILRFVHDYAGVEISLWQPIAFARRLRPRALRRAYYALWLQTGFQRSLPSPPPDIVHFTNYLRPFRQRLGVRYVVTVHDLVPWKFPETLPRTYARYTRWAIMRAVKSSGLILAVSDSVRQDLIELFGVPSAKVVTAYNGATEFPVLSDKQRASTEAYLRERIPLGGQMLLFVGTLEKRKNVITLLKAFGGLVAKYDLQLVLVGRPGFGFPAVEKWLLQQPFRNRCTILGYVEDAELAILYRLATAFVYPSLYEGFGIPLVEAMASGLPIVASRIPSSVEVAGDAAVYYDDPFDDGQLAIRIKEVLDNPSLRDQLSARGRLRAARFAWPSLAKSYVEAYRLALSSV